jgi:broad specificity phosphatase PhoE
LAVIALLLLGACLAAPPNIVFVRHAETIANATGRYNESTLNTLSAKGQNQVRRLTVDLGSERFDRIVVSPAGRCLQTIGPWLRANRLTAEIWPELLECCQQPRATRTKPAGPVRYGAKVSVPTAWRDVFRLVPGQDRAIVEGNYQEGIRMVRRAADRLRVLPGERILVVGHSASGGRLFRELLGQESGIRVENATIYRFEWQPGGAYRRVRE